MDPLQPPITPPNQPPTPAQPVAPPPQTSPIPPTNTTPSAVPPKPPTLPPALDSLWKRFTSLPKKTQLIIGGAGLLLMIILFAIIGSLSGPKKDNSVTTSITPPTSQTKNKPTPATVVSKKPSHLFVYGAWTGQTSVVKAIDTTSANSILLATLPLQIKKISVLTRNSLLYIDQTDTKNHGKRISIYDTKQKTISTTIPAANNYSIDDYVLSPDKKYLVLWEISFAPGMNTLQGGNSRVYAVDLTRPTVTNLLYDEAVDTVTPVHYPRAILNDGSVFVDTFMADDPNGPGWAYGMSLVDFDGTNKKELDSMQNGTYATPPSLSPDGKYLLFSGYDGTQGDGKAIKNGNRQALVTPNTVEVLNTQSLQRFQLPGLNNSNTYVMARWDNLTGNVIITTLKDKQLGFLLYDLAARTPTQITMPVSSTASYNFIAQLSASANLIGTQSQDPSNLGNLGETPAFAFTQIAALETNGKVNYIATEDPFMQAITVLHSNYFK